MKPFCRWLILLLFVPIWFPSLCSLNSPLSAGLYVSLALLGGQASAALIMLFPSSCFVFKTNPGTLVKKPLLVPQIELMVGLFLCVLMYVCVSACTFTRICEHIHTQVFQKFMEKINYEKIIMHGFLKQKQPFNFISVTFWHTLLCVRSCSMQYYKAMLCLDTIFVQIQLF